MFPDKSDGVEDELEVAVYQRTKTVALCHLLNNFRALKQGYK